MICSKNFIAIPPGETIREQLENRGMTQKEFAQRMDMSEKHISNLINGKVELTIEMALRLEDVFGIPASFWSNLERIYREKLVRVEHELALENDEEITKKFPYSNAACYEFQRERAHVLGEDVLLQKCLEIDRFGAARNALMIQTCERGGDEAVAGERAVRCAGDGAGILPAAGDIDKADAGGHGAARTVERFGRAGAGDAADMTCRKYINHF